MGRWLGVASIAIAALICLCAVSPLASAAMNGRIAFGANAGSPPSGVFTVNPDGSDPKTLLRGDGFHDLYFGTSFSPNGKVIAYSFEDDFGEGRLGLIAADGSWRRSLPHRRSRGRGPSHFDDTAPSFSPNGKKIVFARRATDSRELSDLFVMRVDGSDLRRLTRGHGQESHPEFSPDGRHITFDRHVFAGTITLENPYPGMEIFAMRSSGTHVRRLTHDSIQDEAPTYSPDGRSIIWSRHSGNYGSLWEMTRKGASPHPLMDLSRGGTDPDFSPDGRWILFEDYNEPYPLGAGIMPASGGTPVGLPQSYGIPSPLDPTWQPLPGK
jgi:TolB protein